MFIGQIIDGGKLECDLPTLVDTRLLIQANSGGGKSWLLRLIAERAGMQTIVLDNEGEFATLREAVDMLLVGASGELPASPRHSRAGCLSISVRAILDQQLTARDAATVVKGLVRTFGTPFKSAVVGLNHLFPRAEHLVEADLSVVGIRGGCARAIRALARAVVEKRLTFETSKSLEDTLSRVCTVRGIGERESHYIAMRAFGEPDALPFWDHKLRGALNDKGLLIHPADLLRISEPRRPWRAYAAMHLWVAGAEPKQPSWRLKAPPALRNR